MKKTFCPFINGKCREDCVFRTRLTGGDSDIDVVPCIIALSTGSNDTLCDIIIKEREQHSSGKRG